MKKVLITGGAGFIGTNVAERLAGEECYEVFATYHHAFPRYKISNVNYIPADLTDMTDCMDVMKGVDYVVMCAASVGGILDMSLNPLGLINDSTRITINTMEAAYKNRVQKCIFISSGAVYPELETKATEEMAFLGQPVDKYFILGWAKRFGELLCNMYSTRVRCPMSSTILRIDNLYGPYDTFEGNKAHVIPSLIRKVMNRENPIVMWGDGEELKDFMYVGDLADIIAEILKVQEGFHEYNVVTGTNISLNEALALIMEIAGCKNEIRHDFTKPASVSGRNLSNRKLYEEMGLKPSTSLNDGLRITLQWYRDCYAGG